MPARSAQAVINTRLGDCTRIRVLAFRPRRSAANTLLFLERKLAGLPFPIQRIQTDRGAGVLCTCCSAAPDGLCHQIPSSKPASPHLNGKVERSQRTNLEEFRATTSLDALDWKEPLFDWQDHYNHFRPHHCET